MNQLVELAQKLVSIPSVNPMGGPDDDPIYSEKNVADFIFELLEANGAHPTRQGSEKHPNVVAHIDAKGDSPIFAVQKSGQSPTGQSQTLLLIAHTDTVSHENMTIDPFDPVIRDGRLYGRGSCDTKASLAVFLDVFIEAIRNPSRLKYNLIFAAVHDEEYSFAGSRLLAKSGIAADWAIAGEPTKLRVIHAHKGVCRFVVSTHGTSAHGALPWLGENAIYKAAGVIEAIEEYAAGVQRIEHPILGKAAANLGIIAGGTTINTVPDLCALKVERRLLPGETLASALEPLQEVLAARQCAVEIAPPLLFAEAVWNDPKSPHCTALLSACASACTEPGIGVADYATDACTLQAAGIPTLVFGPGDVAQAHTADESVDVEEIIQARRILNALLFH
jgi:acetylornithine deacetylase/succinyl-diaminopimelate desuccinylase family protein